MLDTDNTAPGPVAGQIGATSWPVLTIRQPWCWSIVHGGKPVDNRGWPTRYRGPLWLHAGARSRWDPAGASFPLLRRAWHDYLHRTQDSCSRMPESDVILSRRTTLVPFGAVVALAQVTGCHDSRACYVPSGGRGPGAYCSPWGASEQFHIELADVRPLAEPVPCRGMLGLWRLSEDVERAVRAQLDIGAQSKTSTEKEQCRT